MKLSISLPGRILLDDLIGPQSQNVGGFHVMLQRGVQVHPGQSEQIGVASRPVIFKTFWVSEDIIWWPKIFTEAGLNPYKTQVSAINDGNFFRTFVSTINLASDT